MKIKTFIIIVELLQLFLPEFVSGNGDVPKLYYIRPIEVVCDYPFNDTTKWAITCRVWGLLKYYHPNVTAGNLDWDQVLIDRFEKINEANTPEMVNIELMKMIRIAGEYELLLDNTWNDSLNMNVNLCWLDHSFINDTIRKTLSEIASITIEQPSYYIRPGEEREYEAIPNEKDYDKDVIFQYEYRLLALFRYWNIVYYFFPYKYLMDQSWDVTLLEFIPQFMNAFDLASYSKAVITLATRLNDGHASTSGIPPYSRSNDNNYRPITLIDSATIVRTKPRGSLLERGDIILNIDGKSILSIRDSLSILIPSSNLRDRDNVVNDWIYRSIIKGGLLSVIRNKKEINFRENRTSLPNIDFSNPYFKISSEIGYANLSLLKSSDIPAMIDSLNNCRGIIYDLRSYPLYIRPWELISHLSSTQEYHYASSTLADLYHCGAFYKFDWYTKCPDELWQERKKYNGKIVVLIQESTISYGETLSMMFRTHGATLVGVPTAGANGNVTRFKLPGNIYVSYSGIGFYYSNGEQTQRTGIIPDIEVYPTMDDIMAGRDEVLEAAISFLNSQ